MFKCYFSEQVLEIDSLTVNLHMASFYLNKLFSIRWRCESGLVENIEMVVEEYRQSRGLLVATKTETG